MPIQDLAPTPLNTAIDTPQGFVVTPGKADVDLGSDALIRGAETWAAGRQEAPTVQRVFDAAFDQDNVLRNVIRHALADPLPQDNDPAFKGWDSIKGTPYEVRWSSFTDIPQNREAYDARKRKIDDEEEGRRILDAAPRWQSLPAQMVAGTIDLPTLLPGGTFVRGVKGGFSVARSGLSVGAAAGVSSLAQETALHALEETRTVGESAINVGASVILGGLLGAGGAKLLTGAEWTRATRSMEWEAGGQQLDAGGAGTFRPIALVERADDFDAGEPHLRTFGIRRDGNDIGVAVINGIDPKTLRIGYVAIQPEHPALRTSEARNLLSSLREFYPEAESVSGARISGANPRGEMNITLPTTSSSGALTSAGAAANLPRGLEGNTIAGRAAQVVAASTERLNPALRLLQSPSPATREISTQLFENSLYLKKNFEGVASDPAVETLMKEWNGGLAKAIGQTNEAFSEYRKAGGALKRDEFRDAVGKAMRRADDDPDPHVAKVAKEWRSKVFDPLKQAAIEAKLLPADVSVETAASYFSRMWNKQQIIAREGQFKGIVAHYYEKLVTQEYEKSASALNYRLARFDQEISDISLAPAARTSMLAEVETKISDLYSRQPDLGGAADRIAELRGDMVRARRTGDAAAVKVAKDEIVAIREKGGTALAAYMTQLGELRTRRRNVDLGTAGLQERSDRALMQLADLEEANHRSMERLVAKGQKLERDLDRLDADALEARVTQLADQYSAIAQRAHASAERAKREIEGINKRAGERSATKNIEKSAEIAAEADAKIAARMAKEVDIQTKRAAEMNKVAARLDVAKNLDHDALMAEIKAAIDKATRETSSLSLSRGERAAKLGERMAALDPQRVAERIKTVAGMRAQAERAFLDRWEIKNLGEGVDIKGATPASFKELSSIIADHLFNQLAGKNVDGGVRPEFMTVGTRGPMKDRTFNIPDTYSVPGLGSIEEFLEHDVELVGRRYARVMGADVELARKFGSPDMVEQISKIKDDYNQLRQVVRGDESLTAAAREKELKALGKAEKRDKTDLEALRDLLRGTRQVSPIEESYNKLSRGAVMVNYFRSMGEVVLASLTDAIRPAMVHGLSDYMTTTGQLVTNIKGISLSVAEAQLAGNVAERVLGHRLATVSEIIDPYASRGPVEAFLENMTNVASKWNGIRIWTDGMKSIASVMTQNRILEGAEKFTSIRKQERAYLAYLGIDQSMAERIAAQFAAHGETLDGVRVANTAEWTDPVAVRTYRAAMNKDVDSIIVQKSVADVPLFASTPTGRMLLQFKSFALASHQKVLLRGLQEDQSRFIGGTIAMTMMGMLITYLKAVSGNRPETQEKALTNSGWLVTEGLDRSGILSVPMELSNAFEKAVGVNPIKAPLKAFDPTSTISQKNQFRNQLGSLLGPTFGMVSDAMTVGGIPKKMAEGKEVSRGDVRAGLNLLPYNSYAGIRQMLNYIVAPPQP